MAMDATTRFDPYVFDTLMRDLVGHDRRPAAFLVYVALAAHGGWRAWSHVQLAEHTGLAKRTVQEALRHLSARGLVAVRRGTPVEPAVIEVLAPWRR